MSIAKQIIRERNTRAKHLYLIDQLFIIRTLNWIYLFKGLDKNLMIASVSINLCSRKFMYSIKHIPFLTKYNGGISLTSIGVRKFMAS